MANSQLAEAAQKAIQDKQFNAWLKGIGEEGQKQIKKLFLETAEKDQKLKAMAQEDPQSTMILFAYQVYQQQSKQSQNSQKEPQQEEQNVEPEEEELEDMNNPPLTSPISAKFGAKLNHIIKLNGHCPEGYEIQYYSMGGHLCGKCRKKKQMLMQNMACGGKKRIKKGLAGMAAPSDNRRNTVDPRVQNGFVLDPEFEKSLRQEEQRNQANNGRVQDTYSLRNWNRKQKMEDAYRRGLITGEQYNEALKSSDSLYEQEAQEYQNFPSLEEIRMIQDPVERKRMEEEFWKRYGQRYRQSYKKGGKTLTKAKANSLKYKGGPGDVNSTEGMKPNKKQRRMLCKKIGGMVNNAKKITIYNQPDMFDVIH